MKLKETLLFTQDESIDYNYDEIGDEHVGTSYEEMVDQMIKLGQNESTTLYYNPEEWIFFDDLLKEIPILENYSKIQFIKRKKKTILEYNDFIYFVNIYDYIIKNGTSPLSFEVNKIKSIILNQRSKDLRKKLRLDLYDDGIKNSYIEKYRL
jgi:hypothetical protein